MFQDIRFAFRALRRAPGFTLAAVLSLALGIGANTAIFNLFNSALLRPLPVEQPDQLVRLKTERGESFNLNFSSRHFEAIRAAGVFAGMLARTPLPLALRVGDDTEQVEGAAVTPEFFETLGVRPVHGRSLIAEGNNQSIVIGHAFWNRKFAGRPEVVGSAVQVNGHAFTIVGVAPAAFTGLVRGVREDFWISLSSYPLLTGDNYFARESVSWLDVVARLKPEMTLAATQARLAALDVALRERKLIEPTSRNIIEPASGGFDWAVADLEQPLRYLLAAVVLVLLIACANVANLLLARGAARSQDLAIRTALGASRWRLTRQTLVESLLLAVLAGTTGLLVASWITDALLAYRPAFGVPLTLATGLDTRVLGFTVGVSLLTGIVFGLGPALHQTRLDVMPLLKNTAGRITNRLRGRSALVVVQVALSLVLLAGATVLVRSLSRLTAVDLGFSTRNALLASIDLNAAGYNAERGRVLVAQLLTRVRALPNVAAASAATVINPNPGGSNYSGLVIDGYQAPPGANVNFDMNIVDAAYFETIGLPIVRGRGFNDGDRAGGTAVVVINEEGARRYWPGRDPIGQRIYLDEERKQSFEVIGIARDSKYRDLREDKTASAWSSLSQAFRPQLTLIVHTRGKHPLELANVLRSELRSLDAAVPLFDVKTLEQHIGFASSRERMATRLALGFSALALLLASLGLYGLLSFLVTQRTREIGVRIALGARRSLVLRQIMGRGLVLVGVGLVVGVPLSLLSARLLRTLVYGVSSSDLLSLVVAVGILTAAALAAAFLPARRAVAVDPLVALRAE
jgi:predicted permease